MTEENAILEAGLASFFLHDEMKKERLDNGPCRLKNFEGQGADSGDVIEIMAKAKVSVSVLAQLAEPLLAQLTVPFLPAGPKC